MRNNENFKELYNGSRKKCENDDGSQTLQSDASVLFLDQIDNIGSSMTFGTLESCKSTAIFDSQVDLEGFCIF